MRDNVEAEGSEDYFMKSIIVPFFDYALNEMKTRLKLRFLKLCLNVK
jgi:hypothetical protein